VTGDQQRISNIEMLPPDDAVRNMICRFGEGLVVLGSIEVEKILTDRQLQQTNTTSTVGGTTSEDEPALIRRSRGLRRR